MQDRVYIANPTGSGPTYTVDLYFTGNPANARTGDQVVDSLGHLYTLTGLGTTNGAQRTGVTAADTDSVSVSPALGYAYLYTPTAKGLSQAPATDVEANQGILQTIRNRDNRVADAAMGGIGDITAALIFGGM